MGRDHVQERGARNVRLLSLELPIPEIESLRDFAANRGQTVTAVVREAIQRHLAYPPPPPAQLPPPFPTAVTPSGNPSKNSVAEVARAILDAGPPKLGLACPRAGWVTPLRRAGWPITMVTVSLPQREHRTGSGRVVGEAPQPVACVPDSWLRELARRLGVEWEYACRVEVKG